MNAIEQANNYFDVMRYLITRGLETHCRFLLQNLPVGDDENQGSLISTMASYYPDAENAINGFIDRKPTFDWLGVNLSIHSSLG